MNYDIKIQGDEQDNGSLEFDRLSLITHSTKDIATKALMLKMHGFSNLSPSKGIKSALAIRLQSIGGSEVNGTNLTLDCDPFSNTLKELQLNIFHQTEEILSLTPMALVIQAFRSALVEGEDKDELDRPLLKSLLNFKKNFVSNEETFHLSNRKSLPDIEIRKVDFKKIELIEESIPEPQSVIINGRFDEIKVSKGRLGLLTEDGIVNVFAKDKSIIENILDFLDKEVTISGLGHFKPSGKLSYVEIQKFKEPGKRDSFFSKRPSSFNAEQQILFQLQQGKNKTALADILGKWPGNETDAEFENILKDLD